MSLPWWKNQPWCTHGEYIDRTSRCPQTTGIIWIDRVGILSRRSCPAGAATRSRRGASRPSCRYPLKSTKAAAARDDDPAAVGISDVVELEEMPATPTNQRASGFAQYGFGLDFKRREHRGSSEESIAGFSGLKANGGPRNESEQRNGLWLTGVHENVLWVAKTIPPHGISLLPDVDSSAPPIS